jgi:hypothetical protein
MPCAIRTTRSSSVTGIDLVIDGGMTGLVIATSDRSQEEL